VRFFTISTPIFYESERSFVPATACLYLWYYPRAGNAVDGDCSQALIVRRTRSFRLDNSPIRADVHRTGVGRLSLHYSSQITIYEASADPSSLVIMIIFIGFLIPVMLFYNLYQYIVFVAKSRVVIMEIRSATEHDSTC